MELTSDLVGLKLNRPIFSENFVLSKRHILEEKRTKKKREAVFVKSVKKKEALKRFRETVSFVCFECQQEAPGDWYLCADCDLFELCQNCFSSGKHSEHFAYFLASSSSFLSSLSSSSLSSSSLSSSSSLATPETPCTPCSPPSPSPPSPLSLSSLQFPNHLGHSKEWTITLWVYIEETLKGGLQQLFFYGIHQKNLTRSFPSVQLLRDNFLQISVSLVEDSVSELFKDVKLVSDQPLPPQEWVHLSFVCSEKEVKLYVNGALGSAFKLPFPLLPPPQVCPVLMGEENVGTFKGCLSDSRLFFNCLEDLEILDLYLIGPLSLRKDEIEFQILTTLVPLFRSPNTDSNTLKELTSPSLILLLMKFGFKHSSVRIQAMALELLSWILPTISPKNMELVQDIFDSSIQGENGAQFLFFLFQTIFVCIRSSFSFVNIPKQIGT